MSFSHRNNSASQRKKSKIGIFKNYSRNQISKEYVSQKLGGDKKLYESGLEKYLPHNEKTFFQFEKQKFESGKNDQKQILTARDGSFSLLQDKKYDSVQANGQQFNSKYLKQVQSDIKYYNVEKQPNYTSKQLIEEAVIQAKQHKQGINLNFKKQPYSPFQVKTNQAQQNQQEEGKSSRKVLGAQQKYVSNFELNTYGQVLDSQNQTERGTPKFQRAQSLGLINKKKENNLIINLKTKNRVSAASLQKQSSYAHIKLNPINESVMSNYNYQDDKSQRDIQTLVESHDSDFLTNQTKRENKELENLMMLYPEDKMQKLIKGFAQSENGANQLYGEFQQAFQNLNNILKTTEDNIIYVREGTPTIFELQREQQIYYNLKIDLDINPSGVIKVKIEKIYGKIEIYVSEINKKPNKINACKIFDKDKFSYEIENKNKFAPTENLFVSLKAKSDSKGTILLSYDQQKNHMIFASKNHLIDEQFGRRSSVLMKGRPNIQQIVNELKESYAKRSDFLASFNKVIQDRALRQQLHLKEIGQSRNFLEENKNVSPYQTHRESQKSYFNNLKSKHEIAFKKKDEIEKSHQEKLIIKQHRQEIKMNVQKELVQILYKKKLQKEFFKTWLALRLIHFGIFKLNHKFARCRDIYLFSVKQYFMAKRIQRAFKKFLKKNNGTKSLAHALKIQHRKTFKQISSFLGASLRDITQQNGKILFVNFIRVSIGNQKFQEQIIALAKKMTRLKEIFIKSIQRRKKKLIVMRQFWNSISDKCYFLSQSGNASSQTIKYYNGHLFHRVNDQRRDKTIRKYLKMKEDQYREDYKKFFDTMQSIDDKRVRISCKMLVALTEQANIGRSIEDEQKKITNIVHKHIMANALKLTNAKKRNSKKLITNQVSQRKLSVIQKKQSTSPTKEKEEIKEPSIQEGVEFNHHINFDLIDEDIGDENQSSKSEQIPQRVTIFNQPQQSQFSQPKAQNKKESNNNEFTSLLNKCKAYGISVPNIEYIPSFKAMIQLMNEGLQNALFATKNES